VWLEGSGKLKNPITSSGLEPKTFWLVALLATCLLMALCFDCSTLMIEAYVCPVNFY
jgi:hypothetical protein